MEIAPAILQLRRHRLDHQLGDLPRPMTHLSDPPYRYIELSGSYAGPNPTEARIDGRNSLAIEVSSPSLLEACALGKIDPQHGATPSAGVAAIDAALHFEPLPPVGSFLVTEKADADSLGAMAVLSLRATGHMFDRSMLERVHAISSLDRRNRGHWEDWARQHPPLPIPASLENMVSDEGPADRLAIFARQGNVALADRVAAIAEWLANGAMLTLADNIAEAARHQILQLWNTQAIHISEGPVPWIGIVRSPIAAGLDLAYRHAPVVIAETVLNSGRKLTVAQFEAGWFDRDAMLTELAALEPGWGGQANIIGSPRGVASRLDADSLTALVVRHAGPFARQFDRD